MCDKIEHSLLSASARIGADPMLVQGAGGNMSYKRNGVLWVKASGKWMARALVEPILVPLDLMRLRRQLAGAIDDIDAVEGAQVGPPVALRPSIETTLHVVMPQRVVIHVHCVATIVWAVQIEALAALTPRLADLDWAWIPYARPGLPLTRMVQAHTKGSENVLVLGNHGLVVGADSISAAVRLLTDIQHRLLVPPRLTKSADLVALRELAQGTGYRLPGREAVHDLANDPASLAHAASGSLYPDHVVFLGHGVAVLQDGEKPRPAAQRVADVGVPEPALVLVPGVGVLMRNDVSLGGEEMALCLAHVAARIAPDAKLSLLTTPQEFELFDWDAEKFRRGLDS